VSTYFNGELVESNNITNTAPLYEGILTLDYHNKMVITFNSTARPYQHLHLQQLLFGIGFVYSNEEIIDISFNRSTSPVSLELPSSKPSFSLYNESGIFSPDSASSVSSFFSEDQECKLSFGHDVTGNGGIEWVGTGKFWLSKWFAEGITAKFEAVDIIERMSATTYRRGTFGYKTARTMVDDVMADFGYDNYDADNYELWNTYIKNPLPIASHAVCLQLIANYAMCTLETDEDGMIIFRRRTDPVPAYVIPLSTSNFLVGSTAANLTAADDVVEYASLEPDGFALSGDMLFVPDDDASYENAGLVWDLFPDENGKYVFTFGDATKPLKPTAGPAIRVDFAANVSWGSTTLDFGANGEGYSVRLRGFRDAGSSTYAVVYDKVFPITASPLTIVDNFDRIVWLYIMVESDTKGRRARIQRASFSWENGYEITAADIFGNPKGTKLANCKNLIVKLDNRTAETAAEIKKATITAGEETWIEHGDMYQDVTAATTTSGATLTYTAYAYATRVTASGVAGDVEVTLTGKKLVQGAEDRRTVAIGVTGEDCTIENPLLSASSLKAGYLDWLAAHFAQNIEWVADTLGYPELQPGDPIGYKGMRGSILDAKITYKFSLREQFTIRKEEVS
jgi:hypothetical protein